MRAKIIAMAALLLIGNAEAGQPELQKIIERTCEVTAELAVTLAEARDRGISLPTALSVLDAAFEPGYEKHKDDIRVLTVIVYGSDFKHLGGEAMRAMVKKGCLNGEL